MKRAIHKVTTAIANLTMVCLIGIGCSSTKMIPGTYKGDVGAVAFANHQYTFNPDGTFVYQDYTDNSSDGLFSNYGEGTYSQDGNRLLLQYDTIDTLQTEVLRRDATCQKEDTLTYTFVVVDSDGKPLSNFKVVPEGEQIQKALMSDLAKEGSPTNVYDGNYIPNIFTQKTGREGVVIFHFPTAIQPTHFTFGRGEPNAGPMKAAEILYPIGKSTKTVGAGCYEYNIEAHYVSTRPIRGGRSTELRVKQKGEFLMIKQQGRGTWRRYKKID